MSKKITLHSSKEDNHILSDASCNLSFDNDKIYVEVIHYLSGHRLVYFQINKDSEEYAQLKEMCNN